MPATFAGQPLLLEDPGGDLHRWLDWALPLAPVCGQPVCWREGRDRPRSDALAKVGLPIPNYQTAPPLAINSVWIPTGAARWGVGLFLIDQAHLEAIQLDSDGRGALIIEDGNRSVYFQMYPLSPRRISDDGENAIYLLPLVDRRWFWQFADAGNFEVTEDTRWDDLINHLRTQGGVSGNTSHIPVAYGQPDSTELTRRYENLALLIDAVAASVGMRAVFFPSTEVLHLVNASSSRTWYTRIRSREAANLLAGGPADDPVRHQVPSQVRVVFPRYNDGAPQADGDLYVITLSASSYLSDQATQPTGTVQTFFDTAHADYTEASSPKNLSDLTDLADQIATDYYAHLCCTYDITYAGLVPWFIGGFDDGVLYQVGMQHGNQGKYLCQTRVRSLPYNFGVRELLHQFPLLEYSSSSSVSISSVSMSSPSSSSTSSTSSSTSSSSTSTSSSSSSSSSTSSSSTSSSSSSSSTSSSSTSISSSSSLSSSSAHSSSSTPSSSTSGPTSVILVQDVCCDEDDIVVCYTTLTLAWNGSVNGYVITSIDEEECICE